MRALKGQHNSGGNKPRLDTCGAFRNEIYNAAGPIIEPADTEYLYNPSEFAPIEKGGASK